MPRGFAYQTVIMDWHSRAVFAWSVSNTLDPSFCVEAPEEARRSAGTWPEIMNTDQGCRHTGQSWTSMLRAACVRIRMKGKGRWVDNVIVERLWRSLKYEDGYLEDYRDLAKLEHRLTRSFAHGGEARPHPSLGWRTPMEAWSGQVSEPAA